MYTTLPEDFIKFCRNLALRQEASTNMFLHYKSCFLAGALANRNGVPHQFNPYPAHTERNYTWFTGNRVYSRYLKEKQINREYHEPPYQNHR